MRSELDYFNRILPQNKKVSFRTFGNNKIKLTPLDPQPEPQHLPCVKAELTKRWPVTNLLDVLK